MSGIWCAIGIDSVVGITVVGNDDSLVVVGLSSLDHILHTVVNSPNSLGNSIVDTSVTYHVAVSKVNYDKVVLSLVDSSHQLILYLEGAHLRLQVVGSNLWTWHQDTILALVWLLASTIEEECHVSILLGLGSVQLLLALLAQILAQSVLDILLREENVHTLEVSVVWSHAVVLQARDSLHALLWHILLSQCDSHLLGTVVTEVDEDNYITLFDATVNSGIVDWLNKLVGNALVVALLHSSNHIGALLTSTLHNQVVTLFYTLPALIAVHSVETTYD